MAMNPTPYSETSDHHGYDSYIKEITLPSGNKYEIVDEAARNKIDTLSQSTQFRGIVSTATPIYDGSTTTSIQIESDTITAIAGDIVIQTTTSTTAGKLAQEYIFDGTHWQLLGDISASNLGNLAYKNNAVSTTAYISEISVTNTQTAAISLTGSYQPAGTISLTPEGSTISLSTTSTTPSNTANYWVYNPADNMSITADTPATNTAFFLTGVTGKSMVSSVTIAAPSNVTPSGGIVYATVSTNNLILNYLVQKKEDTINASTSAAAVTGVSAPVINKSGTTRYVAPFSVTNITAATFKGTTATVTASGAQKIASISKATTSTVTVS